VTVPPLGLLLDVDGPVASPVTRTVAPALLDDLRALLAAGVPVVLNTGRSDAFVRERVLDPLVEAGLPPGARLHAVCEKGAVELSVGPDGVGDPVVDRALAVPAVCGELIETLVGDRYGDTMFVDRTKRCMATVEARTDVPADAYARAQAAFDAELLAGLVERGLGVRLHDRDHPDAGGRVPWRIDPSVIATDVESVASGKDLGARRALRLLSADGPLPRTWETVGDSPTDYAMADRLHALGHTVTHVDVRPAGPLPERPYRVVSLPGLSDDAAGAAHLRELARLAGHRHPTAPCRR
jgi:hypothetical protein